MKDLSLSLYTITLKNVPSQKIISIREKIPNYSYQEIQWTKLYEHIEEHNLYSNLSDKIYCVYHSEAYQDRDIDLEVGILVKELREDIGSFKYRETQEISVAATALFEGPYSDMAEWEGILACWIEQNNYEINGYESIIGYKHPFNESNSNNYLTEMIFPIRKIKGE